MSDFEHDISAEVGQLALQKNIRSVIDQSKMGRVTGAEPIGQGFGGDVFLVRLEGQSLDQCILKLIPISREVPFEEESDDDRVYGARRDNFRPAYDIMRDNQITVPELYAVGTTEQPDKPSEYLAMEYFEGVSLREYVPNEDEKQQVQSMIGREMGKIHKISRPYQGWVNLPENNKRNWQDIFKNSIKGRLNRLDAILSPELLTQTGSFVDEKFESWVDPAEYVLSHLDGFQGIANKDERGWNFQGVIDIEDHAFTDQRFVLAGHELASVMNGEELGPEFWDAYEQEKTVDPHYEEMKSLFQLYYLLVWRKVFEGTDNMKARAEIESFIEKIVSR